MDKTQKFTIVNRIKLMRAITRRSLVVLGFNKFAELSPESLTYDKRVFDGSPIVLLEIPDPTSVKRELIFLKHLRHGPRTKELGIIVTMTATKVEKKFLMAIIAQGVKDFILKTNDINALAKRLDKTLGATKQRQHKRTKFAEPLSVCIQGETKPSGLMQDITIGGFLLYTQTSFENGTDYSLTVKLPVVINEQETLDVTATCRWSKALEDDDAKKGEPDSKKEKEVPGKGEKKADASGSENESDDTSENAQEEKPQLKAGFQIQNLAPEQEAIIHVLIKEHCTVET